MSISYGQFQGLVPGDIILIKEKGCPKRRDAFVGFKSDFTFTTAIWFYRVNNHDLTYKSIVKVLVRAEQFCDGCLLKATCKKTSNTLDCYEDRKNG